MDKQSRILAIFQVGPVQELIQNAKKTVDYWSGSFILSYFCALAIKTVREERVIFPGVTAMAGREQQAGNPLYLQVKEAGDIPWKIHAGRDEIHRPSLPNRLLCLFEGPDKPREILKDAADTIKDAWRGMAEAVLDVLPDGKNGKRGIDDGWRAIWKKQVFNPFEIFYVWHPWPQGMKYSDAYRRTEALMGSRKATRWFAEEPPEHGHKCSLCGTREALHTNDCGERRADVRSEWEHIIRRGDMALRYKFREGETLCAVCTVKRLAPGLVFKKDMDSPSTSTIACATTIHDLLDDEKWRAQPDHKMKLDHAVLVFEEAVRDAARAVDEPASSDSVPRNIRKPPKLAIDGHWLQVDFYQKLAVKSVKHEEAQDKVTDRREKLRKAEGSLRSLLGRLDEANRAVGARCLPPCKYYGVLVADGDGMGEVLGQVENEEVHRTLSAYLAAFSAVHAFEVLQQEHLGYVVYFGGDEGAAFVALDHLLGAMRRLNALWDEKVFKPLSGLGIKSPTLSIGAAVAHYQDGLRGVIDSAHRAIQEAKDIEGKDAFCIKVSRRSGTVFTSRSKWSFGALEVIPLLERLVEVYRSNSLSPDWIDDLRAESKAIGDPPEDLTPGKQLTDHIKSSASLCRHEIERLVRRHRQHPRSAPLDDIVNELIALNTALRDMGGARGNRRRFQDFLNLMDAAHYVAKGGGR